MESNEPTPEQEPMTETLRPAQDPVTKRFLPGNRISAGHKPPISVIQRRELHKAFLSAVGPEQFRAVVNRHLELIAVASPRDGKPLIELFYQYCLGKPHETVSLDVSTAQPTAQALPLDDEDVKALEAIRRKLALQPNDDTEEE